MTRDGKAGEFSPCERMFVCQVPTSPHPLVPDRKLCLEVLGYGFHGRPEEGYPPTHLHELLLNNWKLDHYQLQLASKHYLTR